MHVELTYVFALTEFHTRRGTWKNWYQAAFASVLEKNRCSLNTSFGINERDTLISISGHEGPYSPDERKKQKKLFQRTVYNRIMSGSRPDCTERIRTNITRWCNRHREGSWGIPTAIGIAAPKIHRHLKQLQKLLPPRVCSSVWRTLWNSWNTHRRWQKTPPPNKSLCFWLQWHCGGFH